MKRPGALTRRSLENIVGTVQTILWPGGRTDEEWSADTIDAISKVLVHYGMAPDYDKQEG